LFARRLIELALGEHDRVLRCDFPTGAPVPDVVDEVGRPEDAAGTEILVSAEAYEVGTAFSFSV